MLRLVFSFLLLSVFTLVATAQDVVFDVNIGLRKTFNLNRKSTFDIRQRLQLTPEIEQYDYKFGNLFNEDGFWPVPDRYISDDDDQHDDDDDPSNSGNGTANNGGELNDTPTQIDWNWRSSTAVQFTLRFKPWIRANTGYSFYFDGDEYRHTLRAEIDYRPLRHTQRKKTLDIAIRILSQRVAIRENTVDGWSWNTAITPRLDAEWTFKKNHILFISPALNGVLDHLDLNWDRYRINSGLTYIYQVKHRFTFSYQFQQRLDKTKYAHGVSFGYEVRF